MPTTSAPKSTVEDSGSGNGLVVISGISAPKNSKAVAETCEIRRQNEEGRNSDKVIDTWVLSSTQTRQFFWSEELLIDV